MFRCDRNPSLRRLCPSSLSVVSVRRLPPSSCPRWSRASTCALGNRARKAWMGGEGPAMTPRGGSTSSESDLIDELRLGLGLERGHLPPLKIRENICANLRGGNRSAEIKPLSLIAVDLG